MYYLTMDDFFSKIAEINKGGKQAVLCIITAAHGSTPRHSGSKMLVFPDGTIYGTVGGGEIEHRIIQEAIEILSTGEIKKLTYQLVEPDRGDPGICGGEVEVYLEPIGITPKIVVIGAGHVGVAIAKLAKWLGFQVRLLDDRKEILSVIDDQDILKELTIAKFDQIENLLPEDNNNSYYILTTRGYLVDLEVLPNLITREVPYLGIIGSKRRWSILKKELKQRGYSDQVINRVISPMGLDLKAETPNEIALSILAEVMIFKNNATGKSLRM